MKILLIFLYSPKKLIPVLFFFGEFYEKILIWEKHDSSARWVIVQMIKLVWDIGLRVILYDENCHPHTFMSRGQAYDLILPAG